MTKFALDTNVLVNAFDEMEFDHLRVVTEFGDSKHNVCLDYNSIIKNEYEKNLGKNRGYRKWFQRLFQNQQFYWCNGHLTQYHKDKLKSLGCHEPTDQTFIGVAYNTDRILISEDSDVGKGPKGNMPPHAEALRYLQNEMKMKILDASEAIDALSENPIDTQSATQSNNNSLARRLKVFLCYSTSDLSDVDRCYRKLTKSGFEAWFDIKNLVPGQNWEIEISQAVRSSDAVIVFLSKASITKEGYVQKEIKIALDTADEKPDGTIFLIPVRLENCEVPDRLNKFQWFNLFENSSYEQLLKALRTRANDLGIIIKPNTKKS